MLRCTAAPGGGAPSVTKLANINFSLNYGGLMREQKDEIQLEQAHLHSWINNHQNLRVYSPKCQKYVSPTRTGAVPGKPLNDTVQILPCSECASILEMKAFKNALRHPTPSADRYKNPGLQGFGQCFSQSKKQSIFMNFAKGAIAGKYDNSEVFIGLVRAMVQKIDRKEHGVTMNNFQYAPAWDEFIQIMQIQSPKAYRFLSTHFQVPSEHNIRLKQSWESQLPMTVCPQTFTCVKSHLNQLSYKGPVGLACDDTKLFSSLRLYWDKPKDSYFLVGAADGPIAVPDPKMVERYMNDPDLVKGTKARLWTINVPLPKVAPILLAALPIPDNLVSVALLSVHQEVISGLLDVDIDVISYSCDGTEVEQAVQRGFSRSADRYITFNIDSPQEHIKAQSLCIPTFRGRPIAMVQNSKHGLKMFRNNLFSGARLLVLGNFTAHYQQVRDIAFATDSPLYQRDVEKLDRQDDNAAAQLSAAATLEFIGSRLDEENQSTLGLIVYLTVFSKLCDAYQNRHISHAKRVTMLLRARYFVDIWEKFVEVLPGYKKSKYFLSHEAVDIIHYLVTGPLSLIIIHRNYHPTTPLLPWLHSTEACKHTFGLAHQIIKDFTMLDFYQMVPKLNIRLCEHLLSAHATETSANMKARAAGYHYTYTNTHGLDVVALGTFPSNSQIQRASRKAAAEAESLWALLGVYLDSLYSVSGDDPMYGNDGINVTSAKEIFDDAFDLEMEELQELIHLKEATGTKLSQEQHDRLDALLDASVALTLEGQVAIHADMPTDEMYEEFLAEDHRALEELESMIKDAPTLGNIETDEVDDDGGSAEAISVRDLIALREQHQTYHAAQSVRNYSQDPRTPLDDPYNTETHMLCKQILTTFHEEYRKIQDQGITTGDGRSTRWVPQPAQTRNSANAATAAKATAKKSAAKRHNVFSYNDVPHFDGRLDNARISEFRPLSTDDYGYMWTEQGVFLGKVITMYAKGGGKHGKHSAVTSASNIMALSYVAVQLHDHTWGGEFRLKPLITSPLQVHAFALIPSEAFLSVTIPVINTSRTAVIIKSTEEICVYRDLSSKAGQEKLGKAMKEFRKREE
ncbi:hypothetical protein AAF712_009006 [Marasmius tenuissimus]|uniref:DRBM domain-containing protein n=1 Tax=Marasmius tenuissimus TaxID=585030 RepID=A0ABR2ZRZ1_9AGAR